MELIMIDNFDSFTYNLVDEFEKRNCKVHVYRNNIGMENFKKTVQKIKPKLPCRTKVVYEVIKQKASA